MSITMADVCIYGGQVSVAVEQYYFTYDHATIVDTLPLPLRLCALCVASEADAVTLDATRSATATASGAVAQVGPRDTCRRCDPRRATREI